MFTVKYNVEENIIITASKETLWNNILTFERQKLWSPRIVCEPTSQTDIIGTDGTLGAIQCWKGEVLGEGEQEITHIEDQKGLKSKLTFKKPFKTISEAYFRIEEIETGKYSVVWGMNGSLPFFLFFLKSMMKFFISSDYKRGLNMLKILCETGTLKTHSSFEGASYLEDLYTIGIVHSAPQEQIGSIMAKDFEILGTLVKEKGITPISALAFYPKVDMKNCICDFITAFQVTKEIFETLEDSTSYIKHIQKEGNYAHVKHVGAYYGLQNAWTMIYMYAKSKKLGIKSSQFPFEIYTKNHSSTIDEKDFVTDLYLPIK